MSESKSSEKRARRPKVRVDLTVTCPGCGKVHKIVEEGGTWRMTRHHRPVVAHEMKGRMCDGGEVPRATVRAAMQDMQKGAATLILSADTRRAAEVDRHRETLQAIDEGAKRAQTLVGHLARAIARLDAGASEEAARTLVRGGVGCAAGGVS